MTIVHRSGLEAGLQGSRGQISYAFHSLPRKHAMELTRAVEAYMELAVSTRTPFVVRNFGTFYPRRLRGKHANYALALRVGKALKDCVNGRCRYVYPSVPAEMCSFVATRLGFSVKEARDSLRAYFGILSKHLAVGNEVRLIGSGTFRVVERKERLSNIAGKVYVTPAHKTVTFSAGKGLRVK